ncbi:zinc finger protein ubi-d4-like isoform X3 [Branchiostoma lanceolatum]|uniref:DPF2 protein n=1 Tax=Branchiostoma lanceolatum TaxID=7740 RepID=A0A8J9ZVJ0_BRALA|nr:DPF2 [Branchiostoma lanceolatum]
MSCCLLVDSWVKFKMASTSSTGGRGIAVKQPRERGRVSKATEAPSDATMHVGEPRAVVGNQFYKEALENASHFNARVVMERKLRLPFLDTLTGVAQTNCTLWMSESQRRPGIAPGQIYTFPAKRWRKKRRAYFAQVATPPTQGEVQDVEVQEGGDAAKDSTLENALGLDSEAANNLIDSVLKDSEDSKDAVDEIDDIPDAGELEDSSSSDDETYTRRKRKRGGRKKKKEKEEPPPPPSDDRDKPYACEWCGKRYKNRPGLTYHYQHFHNGEIPDSGKEEDSPPPRQANGDGEAKGSGPSNYCDFCLGDEKENKKSRMPEELISCSDCGRSGHPTCLQFTPHMTESVKKYRWQCIECKSCHLCGTSENDDQLLFCDDCDRGYHMYCLSPPLSAPPEGSWICKLCDDERKGIIHPPQNGQTVAAPLPHPMP